MLKTLKELTRVLDNYGYTVIFDGVCNLEIVNQKELYYAIHPELDKNHVLAAIIDVNYDYTPLKSIGSTAIFQKMPFKVVLKLNNFINELKNEKAKKYFELDCNYSRPTLLFNIKRVNNNKLKKQQVLYKQINLSNERQNIHNLKKLTLLVKDSLIMHGGETEQVPLFVGKRYLIKLLKLNIKTYLRMNDFSNIIRISHLIQTIQSSKCNNYLINKKAKYFYKVNSSSIKGLLKQLKKYMF